MATNNVNHYIANKIKEFRLRRNMTQDEVAEYLNTTRQAISRYENNDRKTDQDILFKLADLFKVSINDFFPEVDKNVKSVDIHSNTVIIPVLGVITAGNPIEAQENIIDYVEIPKDWTNGGKKFFALKVSGDSMSPKYLENDIVIFEQRNDCDNTNECAVMVNGFDATFKKVIIQESGIILQPLNPSHEINIYSKEQIETLPITILGVAKEIRRKI